MTTITLAAIKTEQSRLAEMIAAFEAQAKRTVAFPETEILLADGEHYAGIIVGKDGAPSHHLILLPGEAESVTWDKAKEFAKKAGGELPSRREQALLYANLKEQFRPEWYWSAEQHASGSDCAWSQDFYGGHQGYAYASSLYRARAVRRLEIQ